MDAIIVAIIGGVFSLVTFLLTRYFTVKDKSNKEKKDKNDEIAKLRDQIEEENKRISSLEKKEEQRVAELENFVKKYIEKQEENTKLLEVISSALQSTLRNDIIKMYKEYYEEKGYMPIYERENLNHMTQKYYSLGGNGVVPSLVEKLYSLGTEPVEEQ